MTKINLCNEVLENAIGVHRSFEEIEPLEIMDAVAVQAMEELLEYRAIGTVDDYWKLNEICKEYSAIGTIEEFKDLKEKSVAKKAEWKFDDFTAKFGNPYHCSNCDEEFGDTYNYCPNCGCDMYAD